MKPGLAGVRLAVLWLSLAGLAAPVAAETAFPLVVEEVASGESTEIRPGARGLHVVFFAPWCPPCIDELKRLAEIEERWAERGYRLVLIAVRHRNTRDRLLRFSEQYRPPGMIYFDVAGDAQRSFAADELPAHVLIDASGREVGRWAALGDELEEAVRKLLLSPSGES